VTLPALRCDPSSVEDLIDDMDPQNILKYGNKDFGSQTEKKFPHQTLVFLTPWNSKGFDYALEYAKKLDYISPVWFDMKVTSKTPFNLQIEGEHNVNTEYIQSIRKANPKLKVVPRFYLDAGNEINFQLFDNRFRMDEAVSQMVAVLKKYDKLFDGMVYDSPLNGYIGMMPFDVVYFLETLSNRLNAENKFFIISVLPLQIDTGREKRLKGLEKLMKLSDKLLYCTYDYNSKKAGDFPISPVEWIQDELQLFLSESTLDTRFVKQKLMLGIPFYGNKYDSRTGGKESMTSEKYALF
jgi:chitinase domain-containing protein 1